MAQLCFIVFWKELLLIKLNYGLCYQYANNLQPCFTCICLGSAGAVLLSASLLPSSYQALFRVLIFDF